MKESEKIQAAHPLNTKRFDLYNEAMRLVGERHFKGDLVDLVNWLLAERDSQAKKIQEAKGLLQDIGDHFVHGSTAHVERLSEEFYKDTGFLAPGKSLPMEMCSEDDYSKRRAAWNSWIDERAKRLANSLSSWL